MLKHRQIQLSTALLFAFLFVFTSCEQEPDVFSPSDHYTGSEFRVLARSLDLPASPYDYAQTTNSHSNDDIVTLGRVLFYDKDLSTDKTVSCASCHKQEKAFADDIALSKGVNNRVTTRNSITIAAVPDFQDHYSGSSFGQGPLFFWDERASTLKEQMMETIENELEMGTKVDDLPEIVMAKDYYHVLFEKAFRTDHITPDHVLRSLEAFMNTITTTNSRFDDAARFSSTLNVHSDFAQFSPKENLGKSLFMANCSSCHGFTINSSSSNINFGHNLTMANNGLDVVYEDKGLGEVTGQRHDNGKFKIPGLRNIELTGPYMHDGRFETLEEVVDFYSEGIQAHENLHHLLRDHNGNPQNRNFSQEEKTALISFLRTLTDQKMVREPKWSDPFKS